jgi:GntR family transcriptional repressor for pyruvate dehydrogenase complex
LFKKVESETKVSQIARQILLAIENGEYKPGDRLPSEREIADQMGVSRNAVRESLKSLQVLEVVKVKTGVGTFTNSLAGTKNLDGEIFPILEESKDPGDIIEARKAFELGFVTIAVANATSRDITNLKESLKKMYEQARVRNYREYLKAGREFHMNLAKSSRNDVIEEIARILWEMTNSRLSAKLHESYAAEHLEKSVEIHSMLVEAMEKGDLNSAKRTLIRHYKELKDFLVV